MEDEETDSPGSMAPTALIMFGIILGGAGLYFGLTANQRISSIKTSIDASETTSTQVEKSIDYFDSQIAELKEQVSEQSKTINRLRVYSSQSEQAVKKLAAELNANREQLIKTTEMLNSFGTSGVRPKPTLQSSTADKKSAATVSSSTTGETYIIAPGDNFSKIASKFGIPVQAIIDANPYADPRRLAIGQAIQIPVE